MMNIQSTGPTDAAASSKLPSGARNGGDDGEGFADALSGFNKEADPQATNEHSADLVGAGEEEVADQTAFAKKPIIDIRSEAFRKSLPARLQLSKASEPQSAVAPDSAKPDARELTAAEKKLKAALAAAKMLTEKADALEKAEGNAPADLQDADVEALLAADGAGVELGDVLSLLNVHGAAIASESMASAVRADGAPSGKRNLNGDAERKGGVATAIDALSLRSDDADTLLPQSLGGTAPGADQVFRLQGAKGERNSVDMVIGEGRGERTVEMREASGGAAETVTVLDSRRFLGLAPNSAALTAALSGDKEWAAAMQPSSATGNVAASSATGGVVNTLKLQMNPHDLGSVTAMLRLQGEQLNVHLTVETRAAYKQLAEDSNGIVDALRSQGFAVDQVTISIAPSSSADQTSNQSSGQNSQQASAQGEKQGNASGRGQGNADARQSAQAGNGNEGASETQAASSPASARSGQLYL